MSIDRLIPTSGAGVTGTAFAGAIQEEFTGLWGNSVIPLTDVAGTANAITAKVSPALMDGLAAGMNFWLVAAADNTGPATIAVGDEDPVDLVDDDGLALNASLLKEGRRFLLAFDGTAMRVYGSAGQKRVADYQVFTADGTWNKPAGTPDHALVIVEAVAGGGGGGSNAYSGGGGGGEYKRVVLRAGDLASAETVIVAASVTARVVGNNSSFGSWVTAYGGGFGGNDNSGYRGGGGGGGGPFGAGGNGGTGSTSGTGSVGAGGTAAVSAGGGGAGNGIVGLNGYFGGGGGGGGGGGSGGKSVYGGAGGAGSPGSPGSSIYGGSGGATAADGQAPGGGGGASGGGGARGEVRVRTIG
jgi:hypothetical protein